jgi:peptide/nickel transport system ATP-binding protein
MDANDKRILEVKDLKIRIKMDEGMLTPVRGVNFSVYENETLGLVGESGCGKSLTCKAILGINDKKCTSSGNIDFYNEKGKVNLLDLKPNSETIRNIRGKNISMVFQEPMTSFSPLFTIGSQMTEAIRLHITKDKKEARDIAIDMMKRVGISNAEKRFTQYPHEFSGGMLQRALIATALVCRPRLLIADEPTTALDVTIQAQILELMMQLQKDYGMGILYVTHDLGTVAKICDRVIVMYLGRIVETAPVRELFHDPMHPYTRGLLGSVHKLGGKEDRLYSIDGTVPLAMNLDDRCGFYDRCACRGKACNGSEPELVEVTPGHFVACCRGAEFAEGGTGNV